MRLWTVASDEWITFYLFVPVLVIFNIFSEAVDLDKKLRIERGLLRSSAPSPFWHRFNALRAIDYTKTERDDFILQPSMEVCFAQTLLRISPLPHAQVLTRNIAFLIGGPVYPSSSFLILTPQYAVSPLARACDICLAILLYSGG